MDLSAGLLAGLFFGGNQRSLAATCSLSGSLRAQ